MVLVSALSITERSSAASCRSIFEKQVKEVRIDRQNIIKKNILEQSLLQTKIKITENKSYIEKVLNRWDLNNSTPSHMEQIAQALVIKLDKRRTFLQWLKEIIVKSDPLKEAVRVRAETLILKREFLDSLEVRGLLKEDSRYDRYRNFRHAHFNKIQLAKFVVVNAGAIYFLGIPLYMPSFNWINNLDLKSKDLDIIQYKGFDKTYEMIRGNYSREIKTQRAVYYVPHAFFVSIAGYTAYNYLRFEATESRYEIREEQIIPESHQLFIEWQRSYEERVGKRPDMKNPQDRKEWEILTLSIYRAFSDRFNEQKGRFPDLSKAQDRLEWEQFLKTLDS